jgi:hypothetical protein
VPTLLGVGCIDMNLIVALDTVRARADWADFDARVTRERAACPRVELTEPQLETLRRSVSEAAVCGGGASPSSQEWLVLTLVARGNVDDYSSSQKLELRGKVAVAAGVDQSRVTISVKAASVMITASIKVPASTTAAAMQLSLSSSLGTADKASFAFGITVESDPTFLIMSDDESSDDATSSDDEGATAGAVAGGVLGGLVAICLLVSSLVYRCRLKSQANAANIQTAARAASSTTGQAQQMTNTHLQVALPISQGTPLSGSSSSTTGQAHPTGNLYPQAYAVGTPVC